MFSRNMSSSVEGSSEVDSNVRRCIPRALPAVLCANVNDEVESDAFTGDFSTTSDNRPKSSPSMSPLYRQTTTYALRSPTGRPPVSVPHGDAAPVPVPSGECALPIGDVSAESRGDMHTTKSLVESSPGSKQKSPRREPLASPRRVPHEAQTRDGVDPAGCWTAPGAGASSGKSSDIVFHRGANVATASGLNQGNVMERGPHMPTSAHCPASAGRYFQMAFPHSRSPAGSAGDRSSEQRYSNQPPPCSTSHLGYNTCRSATGSVRPSAMNIPAGGCGGEVGMAPCYSAESWRERIMWSTRPRRNSPRHTSSYNSSRAASRLATPRAASVPVSSIGAHAQRGPHEDLARFVGAYNTPSKRFASDVQWAGHYNADFIACGAGVEMSHSPRYPGTPHRLRESGAHRPKRHLLDPPETPMAAVATRGDTDGVLMELENYQKRLERAVALVTLERQHRRLRHRR